MSLSVGFHGVPGISFIGPPDGHSWSVAVTAGVKDFDVCFRWRFSPNLWQNNSIILRGKGCLHLGRLTNQIPLTRRISDSVEVRPRRQMDSHMAAVDFQLIRIANIAGPKLDRQPTWAESRQVTGGRSSCGKPVPDGEKQASLQRSWSCGGWGGEVGVQGRHARADPSWKPQEGK